MLWWIYILAENIYITKDDEEDTLQDRSFVEEESTLRKRQIEESIIQQRELHALKVEAAKAEKAYWQLRLDILKEKQ